MAKTEIKTIFDKIDEKNRQFWWTLFSDGSAMSREITRYANGISSVKETYRELHPAGSDEARLIAAMVEADNAVA